MNYEKSTEKCDIPFGVYHVDHAFIQSMRKNEQNIIDPEINDVYCGPVYHASCDRGVFGFFVPVNTAEYNSKNGFVMSFVDGELAGFLDFKKMIPVIDKRFLSSSVENESLVSFCNKCITDIETCADVTMTAHKEKKPIPFLTF